MVTLEKLPQFFKDGYVKSHYKFECFCCNQIINKGDLITKCEENYGITLRYRKTKEVKYKVQVI